MKGLKINFTENPVLGIFPQNQGFQAFSFKRIERIKRINFSSLDTVWTSNFTRSKHNKTDYSA